MRLWEILRAEEMPEAPTARQAHRMVWSRTPGSERRRRARPAAALPPSPSPTRPGPTYDDLMAIFDPGHEPQAPDLLQLQFDRGQGHDDGRWVAAMALLLSGEEDGAGDDATPEPGRA